MDYIFEENYLGMDNFIEKHCVSHLANFVLACHPDKSIHKRKTSKQHQISSIDQTGVNYTFSWKQNKNLLQVEV